MVAGDARKRRLLGDVLRALADLQRDGFRNSSQPSPALSGRALSAYATTKQVKAEPAAPTHGAAEHSAVHTHARRGVRRARLRCAARGRTRRRARRSGAYRSCPSPSAAAQWKLPRWHEAKATCNETTRPLFDAKYQRPRAHLQRPRCPSHQCRRFAHLTWRAAEPHSGLQCAVRPLRHSASFRRMQHS